MKKKFYFPFLFLGMILFSALFSCGEIAPIHEVRLIDSLNQKAYNYRYKNLDTVYSAALQAYNTANLYRQGKAEASSHLGFYAFMQMDFEAAEQYYKDVFNLTSNELECLVADIGLMKLYQRTSMNKEFYDYRNQALSRINRINEDISLFVDAHEKRRIIYALSEFHIVSAIYYYYLQQHTEARLEMDHVKVDDTLKSDVGQWLYYYYVKGSAGLCEAEDVASYIVCKFDNLYYCWRQSVLGNYIYFEANALQGIAELLTSSLASDILYTRRSQAIRTINIEQFPDTILPLRLAEKALGEFKQYDDIYQIAGTYRTIGNWLNERGNYQQALDSLQKALDQVNRHHELYYQCLDTLDRLKTYCPKDTLFIERGWINSDHIKTVPEWIARIREQLSVTYAGLEMKPASDYNRNIYLDILNDTRQDKELESRYMALEEEARELNLLIVIVLIGMLLLIPFFWIFNRRWENRNRENVGRLRKTLDVCQKITHSIPFDAKGAEEIINSLTHSIIYDLKSLLPVTSLKIGFWDEDSQQIIFPETASGEENDSLPIDKSEEGIFNKFVLTVPDKDKEIGELYIYTSAVLKKDDITIIKVILPYIAWVLENGLTFISLGDEQRQLEKELYVHEQHIVENKRQNLIKRTCMSIVVGLNPFIDRIINEISKLREKQYTRDEKVRNEKYQYIDELITKINEYNDILALWIKMKQGALSLNIENFQLNDLFDVIAKGRKTFEMKHQKFTVVPIDVIVKADKALTLFMINTLTENARKYTPEGGEISVYAKETEEFVEISVEDNGRGMSPEDISLILDEKIYDSKQIGIHSKEDLEELGKIKGSGFGLMNCKGIIEKYRKTNEIFRVCKFGVESEIGKGSRFFFRLPKGVRKNLTILLFILINGITFSCTGNGEIWENEILPPPEFNEELEGSEFDRLLDEASYFADTAYYCNVIGEHEYAIQYIDSSMARLNEHYEKYAYQPDKKMVLIGLGTAAEIEWWNDRFDSDYHVILDIRNEAAVAFLALKNWQAYHYNNRAYTGLYKLLGEDTYLEEYCRRLEESTSNKIVGIILCLVLILIFLIAYYVYYVRRRFLIRRNLEEVLDINQHVFSVSLMDTNEPGEMIIPERIVREIFDAVNELLIIDSLGIAVYNEESRKLEYVFNPDEFDEKEILCKEMAACFEEENYRVSVDRRKQCFPLIVEIGGTHRCIGVFALVKQLNAEHESDRILSELVTRFIAIVVFNAVVKLANKYRDIESVQDEANRASHEEGLIHVQNMVLDNCLSTIKHETVYYPNKIKQILDKLMKASVSSDVENESLATIGELISYYKDIYTILSSCASRQLEEVTFRRSVIPVKELTDYIYKYYTKISRKAINYPDFQIESIEANVIGDRVLLKLLLENLLNEAFTYPHKGILKLDVREEGEFIRFSFTDKRRNESVEELNHLFYPHLSSMCVTEDGRLLGVEYLICKQIIRDHDEYAGRRGCRMNAEIDPEGGFTVYFTVPKR